MNPDQTVYNIPLRPVHKHENSYDWRMETGE